MSWGLIKMRENWNLKPEELPRGETCVAATCPAAASPWCWGHGYLTSWMRTANCALDQDRDGQKSTTGRWPQRSRRLWPPCPYQPRPRLGEEEVTLPPRDCGPWSLRPQSSRTSRQSRASVFYKLFYRYGTYILSEIYK